MKKMPNKLSTGGKAGEKPIKKKVKKVHNQVPSEPYRDEEFEEFIRVLKDPTVQAHWYEIAQALKVEPATISRWAKHPKAILARQEGVAEALAGMQQAGNNDWRMYESKLKMLGINPTAKTDITSAGEKIIPIFGGQAAIQEHNSNSEDI